VDGGLIADVLAWIEPRALLLALGLPPVIRAVGHFIPEELFMVVIGVLAARAGSPAESAVLLGAVALSHLLTDQAVYGGGRWLRPRLDRFPRLEQRLAAVTARIADSPLALAGLVPARVLPIGRGAWLAGCGVAQVSWRRFLAWDAVAIAAHVVVWSGLGWWLSGDLARLESTTAASRDIATWLAVAALATLSTVVLARSRFRWQPATVRAARRLGHSIRSIGRSRG
jgi:membrane protein DedA with SNARE-associated domain